MAKSKTAVAVNPTTDEGSYVSLPLTALYASPTNPRKTFTPEQLDELSKSIATKGVINPITVRETLPGTYEVVAGNRRYKAAIMANLLNIPCILRELTDEQVFDIQIDENLHRQDVPPLEEADAFDLLMKQKKLTVVEIAGRVNKSPAYVYRRMKLNNLDELYRPHLSSGALSVSSAEVIASYDQKIQKSLFKKISYTIKDEEINFSDLKQIRDRFKWETCTDLNKAIWPLDKKDMQPGLPACNACPKNTAVSFLLFSDSSDAQCTDKNCWELKETVWKTEQIAQWVVYCQNAGKKPIFADLYYYDFADKKLLEQILEETPEVFRQYSFEILENDSDTQAVEVLFVGGKSWSPDGLELSFKRGWVKVKDQNITGNPNRDWQMENIDTLDVSDEEKAKMKEDLAKEREERMLKNAMARQQLNWQYEILKQAITQTNKIKVDKFTLEVMRSWVRGQLNEYSMRSKWVDVFRKEAENWQPESFAKHVNGASKDGERNPKWTKGCKEQWAKVLKKERRDSDHYTFDEHIWYQWLSVSDKRDFTDKCVLGFEDARVIHLFMYFTINEILSAIENSDHTEIWSMDFCSRIADAAGFDYQSLKPDLAIDPSEDDSEGPDEEDLYDDVD